MKYVLKGRRVVKENDVFKWAEWFETAKNRRVGKTKIGSYVVFTTFLGLDHSFGIGKVPVLWETMITRKGKWLDYQERYTTLEAAEAGHKKACRLIQQRCARARKRRDR